MAQALPTAFSESMSMRSIREPDCPVSRCDQPVVFPAVPRKFCRWLRRWARRAGRPRWDPCCRRVSWALHFQTRLRDKKSISQSITLTSSGDQAVSFQSVSITGANPGDFEESDKLRFDGCAAAEAFVHHLRDLRADERGLEPGLAERDGQRSRQSATVWVERSGDCAAHADARGCAESCRHF